MTTTTLPTRAEIPVEFTWDLASIFPTPASWEASLAGVNARLTETRRFQGHLGEDAEKLADWLEHWQALLKEMQSLEEKLRKLRSQVGELSRLVVQ